MSFLSFVNKQVQNFSGLFGLQNHIDVVPPQATVLYYCCVVILLCYSIACCYIDELIWCVVILLCIIGQPVSLNLYCIDVCQYLSVVTNPDLEKCMSEGQKFSLHSEQDSYHKSSNSCLELLLAGGKGVVTKFL